jgi:cytosine/adenosine deaminase-related metal-dependent hydrolase
VSDPKISKRTHLLKTWPRYWQAVADGAKTFEIRRDDRGGFEVGDELALVEWDPDTGRHTGRSLHRIVTYVLRDAEEFGVAAGFAVLGLGGVS